MKFETTARHLASALRIADRVVERHNTIPILGMVLLDRDRLRATDLDIEVDIIVPASTASGAIAIDHRALLNLVRHIPGDHSIRIEAGTQGATVSFPAGRYDLATAPAKDWPDLNIGTHRRVEFDGPGFRKAIDFVAPFISTEETRYYLNGVCLDGAMAVATDGHRLGCCPLGFDGAALDRMILPRKTISILRNLPAPKAMYASETRPGARFDLDGVTLVTKAIDGTFPDWRRVVPSGAGASRLTVDRASLLRAMARIVATMHARTPYVTLAFDSDGLAISGKSASAEVTAREFIAGAVVAGKGDQVAFNAAYLRDVLRVFAGSDTVEMSIIDRNSPVLIRTGGSEAFSVLMPARVGDEKLAAEALVEWTKVREIGRAA